MSDQARPEEIERHRAADAQAMPSAQARIENAINDIRSRGDRPPSVRLPKLPPTANLRLPQQAANRPSASSRGDPFGRIEPRPRSSLDPEIMPAPPEGSRRLGPILIRSILMVGFAAIVAYGITMLSFFQLDSRGPKSSNNGATVSHEPTSGVRQRLVVEDQQAFANEPILLAVSPSLQRVPAPYCCVASLMGLDCPRAQLWTKTVGNSLCTTLVAPTSMRHRTSSAR